MKIDWADVGISAIESGLTLGAGLSAKLAIQRASIAAKSSIDVKINEGVPEIRTIGGVIGDKKSVKEVAIDAGFGVLGNLFGTMGDVLAGDEVLKIGSKITDELIKENVQKLATSIVPILGGGFTNWAADQMKSQYGVEIPEYTYASAQFKRKNGKTKTYRIKMKVNKIKPKRK